MLPTIILGISVAMMIAIVAFLVGVMLRSIRNERQRTGMRKVWSNFGLSLILSVLFFSSWIAQAMSQWQQFRAEQRTHGEPPQIEEFLAEFSSATLENWQSEFLQLFSFVVLAAMFIHRGSAESKDSDERMEQALQRIEKMLQERKG